MKRRKDSENKLKRIFHGKDILVTGGCGSIGTEIVKQLLKYKPKRVRIFDNNESAHFHMRQDILSKLTRHLVGDIRDRNRVERAMKGADIVFHAAALKHVPLCEYNPFEAVNTNVIGTQNLVDVARKENVEKFLSISTDKAVNPINTMGATKLLSEKLTTTAGYGDYKTKFSCVRFGNVLNSNGSVIPIFKKQIKEGGPVTITSEKMTRFFMSMSEAVGLVLKAISIMEGDEIFILKMKSLRIIDLAKVMIEELAPKFGYKPQNIKTKKIGVRPGEKISECLITKEEAEHIDELDDMFVFRQSIITPQYISEYRSKRAYEEYDSNNIRQLTKEEIRKLLYYYKIIS
ncbi:MAG: polysaccharide biosynthesis protein [Nanoarchaeota archaeon]|nr:polysaccharide biosynthesis protein [DPANN group archaeon]MBL7116669.1 polysaccharide biosynthesis protein [Nanoarchaeota archaeon]